MTMLKTPGKNDNFHDSILLDFVISRQLNDIKIRFAASADDSTAKVWLLNCKGVLRLEYESLGDGTTQNKDANLEIYEIYNDIGSHEQKRWVERLKLLDFSPEEASKVCNVVLASSFLRGWGDRESLEGVSIICREVTICPASDNQDDLSFVQTRIEGRSEN